MSTTTMAPPVDDRPCRRGRAPPELREAASHVMATRPSTATSPTVLASPRRRLLCLCDQHAVHERSGAGVVPRRFRRDGRRRLPELPAWSEPHHVWAPSVSEVDGTYVLHYTTRHTASGRQCISVALAITRPARSLMTRRGRSCASLTSGVRSTRARLRSATTCGCCGSPTAIAVGFRPSCLPSRLPPTVLTWPVRRSS